ncbi:GatB/YqeY domain-containing protein [bacterium]|nr:MAG: GatB/YqeY domain-containing protein [bacterium]
MLEEKILDDFKKAMKDKDALKVSTLSFLRSELKNTAIDKRKQALDDTEAITVIKKQIKQRQDSIEKFKQGSRQDLADKEAKELEILKSYLPQEVSEEEIKAAVEEAIKNTGASGAQDMGKVMKELLAKFAGRADNKLVSEIVKARLSK